MFAQTDTNRSMKRQTQRRRKLSDTSRGFTLVSLRQAEEIARYFLKWDGGYVPFFVGLLMLLYWTYGDVCLGVFPHYLRFTYLCATQRTLWDKWRPYPLTHLPFQALSGKNGVPCEFCQAEKVYTCWLTACLPTIYCLCTRLWNITSYICTYLYYNIRMSRWWEKIFCSGCK